MRPRNLASRDRLAQVLARRAAVGASELAQQLDVSVPTLHRMLQEHGQAIVSGGKARRARYALRRPLRGDLAELPVYAVDEAGQAAWVASLALIHPQGAHMRLADAGWPVPESARDGWWEGLPYPLFDVRPQGYLGRQLARAEHRTLGVAINPDAWSDDDVIFVLGRHGHDLSGNLILGNLAFERWQAGKLMPPEPIKARSVGAAYARLAEQAVSAGVPGSSAAGEFPKFAALRDLPASATPHVLVKFSGADGSPAVQRWADLLVCESLALDCAARLPGVACARSRIVVHAGRTFLEVERFDRHGLWGRSPLVSLATLDATWLGDATADWGRLAVRLSAVGLLEAETLARIDHLTWFGRLVANTDMHTGNLSFQPRGATAAMALAPAYDMLPMLYAPLPGGEVPARPFEPARPLPPQRATWMTACAVAIEFWNRAAQDTRISAAFRKVCAGNATVLRRVREVI